MIHSTAIVSSKAEIEANVEIGAYTVIGDNVTIGSGTVVGPHVVIDPFVSIGRNCRIFQYAALGAIPQDLKFGGETSYVKIGSGCIIREFVTIHRGTKLGAGVTEVGEECLLMNYVHIAHDCKIGRRVVMANNATLAGHITIGSHTTIGGLSAIHQFVKVGDYAFIGGMTGIPKDIPPYVIASGERARLHGLNLVGLKRFGFSQKTISELKKAYRIIFRVGLTLTQAVERVRAEVDQLPEVVKFIDFIKASERGITR
ncbi:MAG TPA: acyl-ACP--UDP-N-acetylglucosamine O-acyltransferase [Desulfobacterales bacterium]